MRKTRIAGVRTSCGDDPSPLTPPPLEGRVWNPCDDVHHTQHVCAPRSAYTLVIKCIQLIQHHLTCYLREHNGLSMQTTALVSCNRTASPLCTPSFCGRRKFLKCALWSERPSKGVKACRPSHQCTVCLIATGGSDSEDDEPNQQPAPSTSGRGQASASSGLGLNPDLEQPVPSEQRPVNELAALRETWLYSWVSSDLMHAHLRSYATDDCQFQQFLTAAGKVRDTIIPLKAWCSLAWLLCTCGWAHRVSNF